MKDLGTFTKARTAPPAGAFTNAIVIGLLLVGICCTYAAVRINEESKAQTQGERV
jgi:cell division protein FtsN